MILINHPDCINYGVSKAAVLLGFKSCCIISLSIAFHSAIIQLYHLLFESSYSDYLIHPIVSTVGRAIELLVGSAHLLSP